MANELKFYTVKGKQANQYRITGDEIQITKTEKGWKINHPFKSGQCNKQGRPYIFEIFEIQEVDYPADFGGYLEFLWNQSQGKNEKWIQPKLNILSNWLYKIEISSPKHWKIGIWKDYN